MCWTGGACRSARSQWSLTFRGDGRDLWQPRKECHAVNVLIQPLSPLHHLCLSVSQSGSRGVLHWPKSSQRKLSFSQRKTNTTQEDFVTYNLSQHVPSTALCLILWTPLGIDEHHSSHSRVLKEVDKLILAWSNDWPPQHRSWWLFPKMFLKNQDRSYCRPKSIVSRN